MRRRDGAFWRRVIKRWAERPTPADSFLHLLVFLFFKLGKQNKKRIGERPVFVSVSPALLRTSLSAAPETRGAGFWERRGAKSIEIGPPIVRSDRPK